MRAHRENRPSRLAWIAALACFALAAPRSVAAQVSSTEPAAVVVFPYLIADLERGEDTLIEIANTSVDDELGVRCFLEDHTPACQASRDDPCVPRRLEEDCEERECSDEPRGEEFVVRLTPSQPLSWWISQGRAEFPLDGSNSPVTNNDGSRIPPVPSLFIGLLRCVSVDADGRLTDRNDLIGNATVRRTSEARSTEARYNGVGIAAMEGRGDGDAILTFGGDDPEYAACPRVIDLPLFAGGAVVRAGALESTAESTLVVATCGQDSRNGSVLTFLISNEFSQRFSTSARMDGQLVSRITRIDTPTPERSIFSAGVIGTMTLHFGITGIAQGETGGTGIVGVSLEEYRDAETETSRMAALNAPSVSLQAERELFPLRIAACVGDCNGDREVTIDELMTGVNLSLGTEAVAACVAFDADVSESVTVDEVIRGLTMGLEGCVVALPRLPAPPERESEPPSPRPTVPGGDITILAVAQADGTELEPVGDDDSGRPIYERPFGHGFVVVFEAQPGSNRAGVQGPAFSQEGLPPLQVIVSRDLGDGSAEVCDLGGGVPATDPLEFDSSPSLEDAVNDLGCRAQAGPVTRPCTRAPGTMTDAALTSAATVQFCLPVARTWAFPVGETVVAARVRDSSGVVGPVREMVVRVLE